jgi:regulator of nucleoside diphosphate kinase
VDIEETNMRDRIFVTRIDFEELCRLVESRRAGRASDGQYLDKLEQELDRAEIVESAAVPSDVVTMNSEVRVKDMDSGEVKLYRLVFPSQARTANTVSVLAPIGTAMLGYRAGDFIEWSVPKGIRRLEVLDVVYQPEAAGTTISGQQ